MTNLSNKHIQKMGIYNPPLDDRRDYKGLCLDFNERTTPPSPQVQKAFNYL